MCAELRTVARAMVCLMLLLPVATLGAGCQEKATAAKLPPKAAPVPPPRAVAELGRGTSAAPPVPAAQRSDAGVADAGVALAGAGTGTAAAPVTPPSVVPWSGTTEPHRRATLTPNVGAIVAKVHVREGDAVKKGDLVVSLSTGDLSLRVRQAEASVRAARVQVDDARVNTERTGRLLQERSVPRVQHEGNQTRLAGAQAGLALAQVALDIARKAHRDAFVRAPFDGVITARHIAEGEFAGVAPPARLVTVEEIDVLDLRIQVPETEMMRAKVGAPLVVQFPALGRELKATITRVVPSLDARTRTLTAIVELPNARRELRPGMFATVQLQGGAR